MDYKTSAEPRCWIGAVPVFCSYDEIVQIGQIRPNPKNPNRHPAGQIERLAEIVRSNGWRNNITVSSRTGLVVRGHGRLLAAQALGLGAVPVEYQEYASEAEELADLAADNRIAELSTTDADALTSLLDLIQEEVPLELAGFDSIALDDSPPESAEAPVLSGSGGVKCLADVKRQAEMTFEGDGEEYSEMMERHSVKRTTDDCFTPDPVYTAIRDWCCREYGFSEDQIVRPFYPGGDYERFEYPDGCVVLDNPPFSILAKILDFYIERSIRFCLFAQATTILACSAQRGLCSVFFDGELPYHNGATIATAIVTNMDAAAARSAPDLAVSSSAAAESLGLTKNLPSYGYPDHVIRFSDFNKMALNGVAFSVPRAEACSIRSLDDQKVYGKSIFGGALLVSDSAAAKAAAARAAAAKAAAARAAAARVAEPDFVWKLSERELEIIRRLGECQ